MWRPDAGVWNLSTCRRQARANNAPRGVTGLLCHHDGGFPRFLEGDPAQAPPDRTDPPRWAAGVGAAHAPRRDREPPVPDWAFGRRKPRARLRRPAGLRPQPAGHAPSPSRPPPGASGAAGRVPA
ncbi:MAG: BLUF domain-containing protein [Pseudomonadota bacterium]